jgi:peptide/nickel transport system permease protein
LVTYVVRRVAIAIPVLLIISVFGFVVLALAPGDPIKARMDRETLLSLTPQQLEERRAAMGLTDPLPVQYLGWLGGVLQGDLGYSISTGQPVSEEIGARIGPTLVLMGATLLIAALVGIPIGIIAAAHRNGAVDYVLSSFTMVMISTPTFLLGLIAIFVFAVTLKWLPAGGFSTIGKDPNPTDTLRYLVMPALILGLVNAAPLARYTRASVLDVLSSDYITTARSKGLDERAILVRHAFRNALLPVITLLALLLPELVAGAVITEQVFGWAGIGRLAVQAAQSRDASVMMAIMMMVAIAVAVANIVADVLYARADPRIRLGAR